MQQSPAAFFLCRRSPKKNPTGLPDFTSSANVKVAGVRPDESARLAWEMIDFDPKIIDLPDASTKDGERRIVDMSDNLIKWLFLCRRPSGKILPENFRRKR